MSPAPDHRLRTDPRRAIRRDQRRLARRPQGPQPFWSNLRVLGMVGWPIALGAVGGAWLGRVLDNRFDSMPRLTLILLTIGVVAGSLTAWRTVVHDAPEDSP